MSGDVQPRKRKEKRRKKDDEDTGTPPPTLISPTDTSAENVTIHIYKESSTGGHWCARIIFFILLAVLAGLIGIIIFEHRGTTDVDTPIASSRWASIFEGWVDDSPSNHGELEEKQEVNEEAEGEEEEEEEEEGDKEEEEEEGKEEEEEEEEEEEREVDRDEKKLTRVEKEEDDGSIEQDTEENGEEEETQEEEEEEEEEEDDDEADKEEIEEEEKWQEEEEEEEEQKEEREKNNIEVEDTSDEFDDDAQQDAAGILEEIDETDENEDVDEENNMIDMELDEFSTVDNSAEEKNDDVPEEFPSIPGVNEIDDNSAEPLEEIEGEEVEEENLNDADSEPEEEEVEEPTSVAVKFGVGVALVVAAHFVLVRRWNNVDIGTFRSPHDITNILNQSRSETIISPSHLKQVIKSIEKVENKTSLQVKNNEDLRSKYNKLQEDNISLTDLTKPIPQDEVTQIKEKFSARNISKEEMNIRHDQSKISSEEEEEEEEEEDYELETSEGEHVSELEEDDGEQMKAEQEYEEEEDEEEEIEDDEEIENVDDSELIAKLDAKYGKLPTPQDSEVEEVEEEAEEEEDEEEEEEEEKMVEEEHDKMPNWKRAKELKGSNVESQTKRSIQQTRREIKQVDNKQPKDGEKAYDFSKNTSNIDDTIVYEENNSEEYQIDKEFYSF